MNLEADRLPKLRSVAVKQGALKSNFQTAPQQYGRSRVMATIMDSSLHWCSRNKA